MATLEAYRAHVSRLQEQVHELSLNQVEMGRIEGELARLREKMAVDSSEALAAAKIKQSYIDKLENRLDEAQRTAAATEFEASEARSELAEARAAEAAARKHAERLSSRLDALHRSPDRNASIAASRAKGQPDSGARSAERHRSNTEQLLLRIRRQDEELDALRRGKRRAEKQLAKANADAAQTFDGDRRSGSGQRSFSDSAAGAAAAAQHEAERMKQELDHMKTRFTLLFVEHKKFVEQHAQQQAQQTDIIQRIRRNIAQMKEKSRNESAARRAPRQVSSHRQENSGSPFGYASPFDKPVAGIHSPSSASGGDAHMETMNEIDYLMSIVNHTSARETLAVARDSRVRQGHPFHSPGAASSSFETPSAREQWERQSPYQQSNSNTNQHPYVQVPVMGNPTRHHSALSRDGPTSRQQTPGPSLSTPNSAPGSFSQGQFGGSSQPTPIPDRHVTSANSNSGSRPATSPGGSTISPWQWNRLRAGRQSPTRR
eukprot:INCI258.1.p1 GENE.INCI258.1~~INCI258.1.p1  ORF type:complete len:546 (-),score=105.57 INCI258.1:49-1515(-)